MRLDKNYTKKNKNGEVEYNIYNFWKQIIANKENHSISTAIF